MYQNPYFRLTVLVLLVAFLIWQRSCSGTSTPAPTAVAPEPSRELARTIEPDDTETTTFSVMIAARDAAIQHLTERSSRLARDSAERRLLAAELKRSHHVQAATVFSTVTPCGDSIRQGVTVHEAPAPGLLGFLKPRQTLVDIHQLTPGATTLFAQTYVAPPQRPRRVGVGAFAGVGIGADLKPQPIIGVGLSYNLFSF